jgi:hypothetical protein
METTIIENMEYDLSHKDPMTFFEANELCNDGWRIATITDLKKLNEKIYVKGNKIKLGGRHNKPKMYWTPGMSDLNGGHLDHPDEGSACTLYVFDLDRGWYIGLHEGEFHLILVRDIWETFPLYK